MRGGSACELIVHPACLTLHWPDELPASLQYVEFPENEGQPKLQLRGFEKIKQLKAGASETATFPIRRKDVMVWDVVLQKWRAPSDGYVNFHVGASSRKLPFKTTYRFE